MSEHEVTIVIIIPCVNEKQYIEECIRAIYANQFSQPVQLAVYVADGMSTDGTRELIQTLMGEFAQLHLLDNPSRFTPFAFNLGIKAQQADYYQIVGARHILSTDYLQTELRIFDQDSSVWCVGGRIINSYVNPIGEIIAKAMSTTFGMGLGNFRTLSKSGYTDTVTSPMYPSWVFEKIGYFDEELVRNQDDDFNYRVSKHGGKIYYAHEIYLKYYVRGNFKNLFKQFFQYGYWKVYVNSKHKTVTTIRQLIPPLFVLFLMCFLLFSVYSSLITTLGTLVLVIYLVMNGVFSAKVAQNLKSFFLTCYTYPILHVSYGLGYLKGIFHFIFLKRKPSAREKQISR